MARVHVLIAAVLFGTTGTAQALGPEIEPLAVGTARIAIGAALVGAALVLAGLALLALRSQAPQRVRARPVEAPA